MSLGRSSAPLLPGIEENHDEDMIREFEQEGATEELSRLDIDDKDLYDTDIELQDDEMESGSTADTNNVGVENYRRSCSQLHITPEDKIMTNLENTVLSLKHQGLGEDGAKALAKSLMKNTKVEKMELNDNSITPFGVTFIADMLCDNIYISYLDLSENDVGTYGCMALREMLLLNTTMLHLILKNCKIKDSDCSLLADGIQKNENLVYLDLSNNELREDGAMSLGNAISQNNSIEQLDLSWNHIRRRGAVQICKGLKRNYCLVKVDLSWNGLGYDGALSLGLALKVNKYIRELDVSSNRLTWNCASVIANGLKDNYSLEVLRIGLNPLTMTGVLELLNAVNTKHSEMEYLSFEGVPINRKIAYIAEMISNRREFSISHGGVIDTDDVLGKKIIPEDHPLTRMMAFLNDRGVRPVDLFRTFERGSDNTISREQFIAGLKKAQVPLETWEMVQVMEKLDKTEEGNINYKKLNLGIYEQKKNNKIKEDQRKAAMKRKQRAERKLLNPTFSQGAADTVKALSTNSSIASNSRRASRISLSVSQSVLDLRRSSSASGFSTTSGGRTTPKPSSGNPSLQRLVNSRQSFSRENELMNKMHRLERK